MELCSSHHHIRGDLPCRNGTPTFDAEATSIAERFALLCHDLASAQIYTPTGKDGIPPNAETAGYPLRDLLKISDFEIPMKIGTDP